MCRPASFIVTKDGVLWSKTSDSHEDILAEYGIADHTLPPTFVRVELCPEDGKLFTDTEGWTFNVDQDEFPDWWNQTKAENKVRAAALRWQEAKVVKPDEVSPREKAYVYGTVQKVLGGTVQKVWAGGTVQEVWDGGTVQEVWGGTVQEVWDGGTVQFYTKPDLSILQDPTAVLVDRSGQEPVCYVGKQEEPCEGS